MEGVDFFLMIKQSEESTEITSKRRFTSRKQVTNKKTESPATLLQCRRSSDTEVTKLFSIIYKSWTVRGSNTGGGRDFPHLSRPALGPTQPPVQWVPCLTWGYRAAGAWSWPLTHF